MGTRPRARSGRRRWVLMGTITAVVLAYVGLCIPIYAPTDDAYDVHDVDAVFILGPPTPTRIALGERVAREAGGVPVYLSVWHGVVCKPRFVCVHADPWTTVGEAAALKDAVQRDGVRHPLVITSYYHEMRARYIFDRCVPGHPPVIGRHEPTSLLELLWQPIYQWGAMAKAVVEGCVD